MDTEIALANERAIIADMLINLLTNVRLTYLPDLKPADAHELLLHGGPCSDRSIGEPAGNRVRDQSCDRPPARRCYATVGRVDQTRLRRTPRQPI